VSPRESRASPAGTSASARRAQGRIFFGERLNAWQLLGSAMIFGSILVLSWPKRVVADEP
jgi:drug/metabolite transporter (DMT)-like permease